MKALHDGVLTCNMTRDKKKVPTCGVFFFFLLYTDFIEAARAMVALATQGEANFARNDLALLEKSAVDHLMEVLDK